MRYQFQSEQGNLSFRPYHFPEAIKILIFINLILFFFRYIAVDQFDLAGIFGLSSADVWPMIWQPITYMFIHGDFFHVFMNMFVLWMFGSEMESIWGRKEFLKYYFITGIGSGLVWLFFNINNPYSLLIGASGAIYGILLAYGLMFPNRKVLIYFLFPIKVKFFVIFLGAIAFFSSIGDSGSNISHLTHLSGMLIGFIYLKSPIIFPKLLLFWNKKLVERKYRKDEKKQADQINAEKNINILLDKINDSGYDSLSEKEKEALYYNSHHLGKDRQKD